MPTFLNLFRRPPADRDAMRESTALTTVYLLELNQKFEGYMRRKVEELEGRVSAQQARYTSASIVGEEPRPVEVAGAGFEADDSFDFDSSELLVEPLGSTEADSNDVSLPQMAAPSPASSAAEPVAEITDYLSLLGGTSPSDPGRSPLETWAESPDLPGELVERDLDLAEDDNEWDTTLSDDDDAEDWA